MFCSLVFVFVIVIGVLRGDSGERTRTPRRYGVSSSDELLRELSWLDLS